MLKKIHLIFLLFFITSCISNLQLLSKRENEMKMEGFYSSYLALEYLDFSRSLLQNEDYINSEYFAKKGLDSSKGVDVILENPRHFEADFIELEDLISAQKRYERIAIPEIKKILPIQMAHLTFLYDCWVSKEAKPAFRLGEMQKCKDRFYVLLEEIEFFAQNLNKEKAPKTEIKETDFERYLVLFDFDEDKINERANKQIVVVLNRLDELDGNYSIILVGNADRVGKNLYNEDLAWRRAHKVLNYITKNGVPENLIDLRIEGEEFPDLITKDKVRQKFNRAVQIYIVKNRKETKEIPLPVIKNETYKVEIENEKKKRGLK